MEYKDLKAGISSHLNAAAEDFFIVGYCLRKISENALFAEDGYKNIWDFAKGEYGLSASSASRFMAINARFSVDDGEHMAEKYIGMGVSKLQEMLSLPDEELEKVTKETTVREIRALKARATTPLSFYGFPATKRPAGSLLTTPGCGEGKHDCFACCRDCAIRQDERYCVTAPMGNSFPCSHMGEDFKKSMQYSLYKNECQMIRPELAPVRAGDKEPSPCCLNCEQKTCFLRCDVAKKKDDQDRKDREAAERQRQREAEAAKPEPSEKDIAAFYRWAGFNTWSRIDAESLKSKYRNAGGGGHSDLKDYRGSARGIRINYKRELTYSQLAKRLTEYQKQQRQIEERAHPDIIDADFREVTDEPETKPAAMTDKEKDELLKEKEPDIIAAFYKSLYPGEKEIIKDRKPAEITKMLKKEYGEAYEGGRDENGLLWNCLPDKINLSISGLCRPLQITWGKFTTKLLAILEQRPELEATPAPEDQQEKEAQESEQDEETEDEDELLCDGCANASALTGDVNACQNCGPEGHNYKPLAQKEDEEGTEAEIVEAQEQEPDPDPEAYTIHDVKDRLDYYEQNLQAHREATAPIQATRKQRIIRDALQLLLEKLEAEREAITDEDGVA